MPKRRTLFSFLILSAISEGCCAADAATLHKFAGLELGYGTYSFEQKIDQKLVFPVASLTAGMAYQRFNFSANVSGSLSDATVSEEEQVGTASRQDFDFTAGYQINKKASVFTGYKTGKTDLSLINRDPTIAGGGNEYYKQKGPYLGVNFNWQIADAGKLAFSIAYATLKAENYFLADGDGVQPGETLEFDDISGTNSGDSNGFSYALNWTMAMKGNYIFRTRIRVNRYKQDIEYQGVTFKDIDESSTMLLVGVTGVF